jgi:uncharacterized membrane protein YphA (DoxX/SURF4 family)
MFPTGTAGAALMVLRVSVAATLVVNGTAQWLPVTSFWIPLGLAVVGIFLCLGLLTPYCATVSFLIESYVLSASQDSNEFNLVISVLNCGVLAVLGPGSYSIDARIFGRRLLTFPSRR